MLERTEISVSNDLSKDAGSRELFTGIAVLFCMMTAAILIYMSIDYNAIINKNSKIEHIMRTYVEKMETTGYLTDVQKTALENELTEVGCSNIQYGTTTLSKVGYGEYIQLDLYYDIRVIQWNSQDGNILKSTRSEVLKTNIHKYRKGTAQY